MFVRAGYCARASSKTISSPGRSRTSSKKSPLWAARTRDGTLSDLSFEPNAKVWGQVCSEAHICTKKFCGQSDRCFYQRARRKFESAPIVVINHTLLFMLLGGVEEQMERESGFLFPNDFLILDEAHTVEQTASRQIGSGRFRNIFCVQRCSVFTTPARKKDCLR